MPTDVIIGVATHKDVHAVAAIRAKEVFLKDLWTGDLREVAVLPPFTVDASPHGTFTYTEGVTPPTVTNNGVVAFSSSVDLVPADPSKATGIHLAS